MSKFKIGDRVIGNDFHAIMRWRGCKGTVKEISEIVIWVMYDGEIDPHACLGYELDLLTEEGAKEDTITPKYLTTITTTTHLEQGQVESLLIKALGIKNGADVQWNQDGSVDIVSVSKEV